MSTASIRKRSVLSAILTDSHFWIPLLMLFFGSSLLFFVR